MLEMRWRSWVATTTVVPSLFSESNRWSRRLAISGSTLPVGSSATQQLGAGDDGAGDGDALLLAARQGRGAGAGAVAEADPGEHLADRPLQIVLVDSGDAQRQRDIVEGGEVVDEAEILEDDADPAAEAGQALPRHGDDVLAEQFDQAAARPLGEVEQFEQRGLAGARRAGEEVEAAVAQREAEVRQRLRPRAVAQADIVELDDAAAVAQTRLRSAMPRCFNGMRRAGP